MADPFPVEWGCRTALVGVVNVTPDSFSGDGIADAPHIAAKRATRLVAEGADILDIGGESTRPGHVPVSEEEELRRVIPAVSAVAAAVDVPISVDTRKAEVARRAVEAGAAIVNDVSGLADPEMAAVVSAAGAGLILVSARYAQPGEDLMEAICADLGARMERARRAGVAETSILIDPGLGFGKGWRQNFEILRRLRELRDLGRPILVGPSRKGMIGRVLGVDVSDRLEGTVALVSVAIANGADAVRVHDVREMWRAVRMMDAIVRGVPDTERA